MILTFSEKNEIIERFQNRIEEARLLKPRGPSSVPRIKRRERASTRNDAALKRARISRARSRGMPDERVIQRRGENNMTTVITTHKTPENFIRANLPTTKQNKKGDSKRLSTAERAFIARRLKKQIIKAGGSSRSRIHDPEITSNVPAKYNEIEVSDAKERVKNLKHAASKVPSDVKKSGAKSGDIISGHPASPHGGGESGKRARQKIYSQIPGAPKKRDPITGKMMGKVQVKEANSPKSDALKTITKNWEKRHKGLNAHAKHDKEGNIRLGDIWIPPEKRNKRIGSRFMKGLGNYADKTKRSVSLRQEPEKGQEKRLNKFYSGHGYEPHPHKPGNYIRHPR